MENNSKEIKSVKEIKELINKVMLPGYSYKTYFSSPDFLVDINYKLVIIAKLIKQDDKMVYEFMLDTQFLSECEITYDELVMCKNIIEILEINKKFVLSKFKKYTVEEYEKEKEERKRQSDIMLEALKEMMMKRLEDNYTM